ncbi:MAG: heme exporter protein CcmD [Paracoccaceae bacterium]
MSDPHFIYVAAAYAATIAILGALVALSARANARAKRELDEAERLGGRR